MTDNEMSMADALNEAQKLGTEHGKNAASWVFDGNTDDETYRAVIRELDAGDPAVYNRFREPSFSGEYGDDYSERNLFDDLGLDYDASPTHEIDQIADAYIQEAQSAFWSEVERLAREHEAS